MLPMMHCLRGIMTQTIVSFLNNQLMRLLVIHQRRLNIDVTPRAFDLGFLTNGFLQANDTMQGLGALLHVISLVDWPKHVKFFFFFFFFSIVFRPDCRLQKRVCASGTERTRPKGALYL